MACYYAFKKYFCCCCSRREESLLQMRDSIRDDDWGLVKEADGTTHISNLVGDAEFKPRITRHNEDHEDDKNDEITSSSAPLTPTKTATVDTSTPSKTKDGWSMYKSRNVAVEEDELEMEVETAEQQNDERSFTLQKEDGNEAETESFTADV